MSEINEPIFEYDELSDTMYITFLSGEHGAGIELNDNILLRINEEKRCVIGLTVFNYSVLAQPTEISLRSLPLGGLNDLPTDTRDLVIEILMNSPVREILSLSAFTPSTVETIPITSLHHSVLDRKAA